MKVLNSPILPNKPPEATKPAEKKPDSAKKVEVISPEEHARSAKVGLIALMTATALMAAFVGRYVFGMGTSPLISKQDGFCSSVADFISPKSARKIVKDWSVHMPDGKIYNLILSSYCSIPSWRLWFSGKDLKTGCQSKVSFHIEHPQEAVIGTRVGMRESTTNSDFYQSSPDHIANSNAQTKELECEVPLNDSLNLIGGCPEAYDLFATTYENMRERGIILSQAVESILNLEKNKDFALKTKQGIETYREFETLVDANCGKGSCHGVYKSGTISALIKGIWDKQTALIVSALIKGIWNK